MDADHTDERGSRPISRVLSRAIIPLGLASPRASSGLPGSACGTPLRPEDQDAASLFGLAPGGVCRAAACCHRRGALLPHRFTLAGPCREGTDLGGLLSVALSVGSRPPGVTWHLVRRSPDFPPPSLELAPKRTAIARPAPAEQDSSFPGASDRKRKRIGFLARCAR